MSLFDRLRNMLSGPPHVADGGDSEAAADLHEEYGTPDAGEADVERMAETGGGGGGYVRGGGFGASEAAEAADGELDSGAPPDPAP